MLFYKMFIKHIKFDLLKVRKNVHEQTAGLKKKKSFVNNTEFKEAFKF